MLASRDSSSVRQGNKLRNQECRAKVLSRGKRRGLRREQSRAGRREVTERALQGYLLASKKVRESNRGKGSDQG